MTERESGINFAGDTQSTSVFENPPEGAPAPVVSFLRLAEREGAYSNLSEQTRQRLEMHFLQGLSMTEIARMQDVSKQAVSQTIKLFPRMLYKKMTQDVYFRRTNISFREIMVGYSDVMLYLQERGKK